MMIRGENVFLRPIEASDFPKLVKWSNDPDVARLLEGDYPKTLEECPAWHQRIQSDRHNQTFALCARDGTLIGDLELDHIAWRSGDAELRIRIGEKDYWNRGYGADGVTALLDHAFFTLNLKHVYLRVFDFNRRAIRCYEKCGFRKEGRLRRPGRGQEPVNVYLMRIAKEEHVAGRKRRGGDAPPSPLTA